MVVNRLQHARCVGKSATQPLGDGRSARRGMRSIGRGGEEEGRGLIQAGEGCEARADGGEELHALSGCDRRPGCRMQIANADSILGPRAHLQTRRSDCRCQTANAILQRAKSADSHSLAKGKLGVTLTLALKVTTLPLQNADFFFPSEYRWILQGVMHVPAGNSREKV